MFKISKQQASNRWDTLPNNLKEALFSEYNAETLWRICENQHLSDDKIEIVATLAGDVILGFLHPEDLAQEIGKDVNIVPEIAGAIASEIDRKIFAPIRADLEKVYAPPSGEIEIKEVEAEKREPEIIENEKPVLTEIRKPEAPIKIVEEEQPKIIAPEEKPAEEKKEEPIERQSAEQMSSAEPLILHKETELKPLSENKKSLKSLGGLFGFLKKKEKTEEIKPVKAEVEGIETKPPKIEEIKPVETKVKVVNYAEEQQSANREAQSAEQKQTEQKQGADEIIDLSKL
jgi:hypothetical protein